jgi:hypothetical protein
LRRETEIEGMRRVALGSSLPIEVRPDLGCEREPLLGEAP